MRFHASLRIHGSCFGHAIRRRSPPYMRAPRQNKTLASAKLLTPLNFKAPCFCFGGVLGQAIISLSVSSSCMWTTNGACINCENKPYEVTSKELRERGNFIIEDINGKEIQTSDGPKFYECEIEV